MLSLPLKVRHNIYILALDSFMTIEPLKKIPPLLRISKEIQAEVLPLIALHTKALVGAFLGWLRRTHLQKDF